MSSTEPKPQSDIATLKGVGEKTGRLLASIGICQISDLWFHLPLRYLDKTEFTAIDDFVFGEYALAKGRVLQTQIKYGHRRSLLVWIEDDTGTVCLRFFYFSMAQKNRFRTGERVEFFGEVRSGNGWEMIHPEINLPDITHKTLQTNYLAPVYSTTKGLQQRTIHKLVQQSLTIANLAVDILPVGWVQRFGFDDFKAVLNAAHHPDLTDKNQLSDRGSSVNKAKAYLVFEELLAHHFALNRIKQQRHQSKGATIHAKGELRAQCMAQLPFALTGAQNRVISEILSDLQSPIPMQRLLQGDVGSGKTIVALMSALDVIEAGMQCAILVPTEILAQQHFASVEKIWHDLSIHTVLLISNKATKIRKKTLVEIASGEAQLIIGTHALFQNIVEFADLGLIIIDEQHRFGVAQREAIEAKAKTAKPNQLLMSATPIPRTLAMTFYQFLEYSVIDELPPRRTPVVTSGVPDAKRGDVIKRLADFCASGAQVYWVCPLIEESETLQCQTASDTEAMLKDNLPNARIGLVHSRIKDKDKIMTDFKANKLDILVATTVIEVGVDVPNASLMIIDNAERLGLSQLHQLRGRVGRGAAKSHCVLLYKAPLSKNAKARIDVMRNSNDGFVIAEEDLKIRGAGELLGVAQKGQIKFRLADFSENQKLISFIQNHSAELEADCDETCKNALIARWRIRSTIN